MYTMDELDQAIQASGKERHIANPGLMTVAAAAKLKGVSKRAVYARIQQGDLPTMQVNEIKLVYRKDVEAWHVNQVMKDAGKRGGKPAHGKAVYLTPSEQDEQERELLAKLTAEQEREYERASSREVTLP